jgi:hypothetical protein
MIAEVIYRGALAHFNIDSDCSGIYYAHLLDYQGVSEENPPTEITLMRGIRKWTGSCNDGTLLFNIGTCIEETESGQVSGHNNSEND